MSGECEACGNHALECTCNDEMLTPFQAWGEHEIMVTAAHRYCLGRRTYIVSVCVQWLQSIWPLLGKETKRLIVRETQEALDKGFAGDGCDVSEWEKVVKFNID